MHHSNINIEIAELIRKDGVVIYENISLEKINFAKIRDEIQKSINERKIYYPKTSIDLSERMKSNEDLKKLYEKQSINGESNIPRIAYDSGEEVWRNITPLITIKDPLFNIKSISKIVFDKNIYDIAYSYLGEKPKIGFVKIKKSYKTTNYSYNQIYHRDDNSKKILKLLVYLDCVSNIGGGFTYVKKSLIRENNDIYYDEDFILKRYGSENIVNFYGKTGLSMLADTNGIHKEGISQDKDRLILIINFVTEEEYFGERFRQLIDFHTFNQLDKTFKDMCQYMNIQ